MILTSWTLFLVLMAFLHSGLAISCFECNSHEDKRCLLDELPKEFVKDCSEHAKGARNTLCRKIVQDIDFTVNNNKAETRVIRTCGWDTTKYLGDCYHRSGYGGRQVVCSCTDNNCNGSSRITIHLGQLIFSIISVLYCSWRLN